MSLATRMTAATEDIDWFVTIANDVSRRINEAAGLAVPVRRYDAPGVSGTRTNDLADSVERLRHADRAVADRDELDRIATDLERIGRRLLRLGITWQPRESSPLDRARTEGDNTPGCTSCARTHQAKGVRRWVAVFRDGLCSWCYAYRRRYGGLPPLPLLEKHHRGERVMVKA